MNDLEILMKSIKFKYKLSKKNFSKDFSLKSTNYNKRASLMNVKYDTGDITELEYEFKTIQHIMLLPNIISGYIINKVNFENHNINNIIKLINNDEYYTPKLYSSYMKYYYDQLNMFRNTKNIEEYKKHSNVNNLINNKYISNDVIEIIEIVEYYKLLDNKKSVNHMNVGDSNGNYIYSLLYFSGNHKYDFMQIINGEYKMNEIGTELYELYKKNYVNYKDNKNRKFNLITLSYVTDSGFDKLLSDYIYCLSYCSIGTDFIYEFGNMEDNNIISIINLCTFIFGDVYITKSSINNVINEKIFCVCKNCKYDNHDMKILVMNIKKWYKEYLKRHIDLLINDEDYDVTNTVNAMRNIHYRKMVINNNGMIYKYNNRKNIEKSNNIKSLNNDIIDQYKKSIICKLNMNNINNIYRALGKDIIRMSRANINSSYREYKQMFETLPKILFNEAYIYFLNSKTYTYDHKYIELPIKQKYFSEKPKKSYFNNLYDMVISYSRDVNYYIYKTAVYLLSPYYNFSMIKPIESTITILQRYNNDIKHVYIYEYNGLSNPVNYNKYLLEKLVKFQGVKHITIKKIFTFHNITDDIHKNALYVFDYVMDRKDACTNTSFYNNVLCHFFKILNRMESNNGLLLVTSYTNKQNFDIINILSKYFEKTIIKYHKYISGMRIYTLFINKKNIKIDDVSIYSTENTLRTYDFEWEPLIPFIDKIHKLWVIRRTIGIGIMQTCYYEYNMIKKYMETFKQHYNNKNIIKYKIDNFND